MTYEEATQFLFSALPMYQNVGKTAFKKDLSNTIELCKALNNPHKRIQTIHVAGTNGKGSSSHMIASVLQEAGYKVGLYTSPHLKSFTERIRINGKAISQQKVVDFVVDNQQVIHEIQPSFFEMTVAMAFDHFAKAEVDVAVIEVGLGGRLDSTNIITPMVSLITNIGWDHMDMLGDTLEKIAYEKAGIIKDKVPVVIGTTQHETKPVFEAVAKEKNASIFFADETAYDDYELDLKGSYQKHNLPGVLALLDSVSVLGMTIHKIHYVNGLKNVVKNTGLKGRWQKLFDKPLTICDTGHNKDGVQVLVDQIRAQAYEQLYLILGFVNDKTVEDLLRFFPQDARFIFCQSKVPRAMPLDVLRSHAEKLGIMGEYIPDVNQAVAMALADASENDMVFVGGSTFVVAELNDL